MPERELTEPVALCRPDGRLNPEAVGWSRHPLHDTDGIGRGLRGRLRNKRWEYWAFTSRRWIAAVTVSMLDYATLTEVWVLDRASGEEIDRTAITPLSQGVELPGTLGRGVASADVPGVRVRIEELGSSGGTRIRATTDRVRLDVVAERPAGHEALGVVVPWSATRFQYTVKDVARPARGVIEVDGEPAELGDDAWAVLDHGRGRWPYRMAWNWGAASGRNNGHTIGLQLGGRWTLGTGSTENAFSIDGRLHKISDELEWSYTPGRWLDPWRIIGDRVALRFDPFHDRVAHTNLGLIASDTHQCFGRYRGTVTADDGTVHPIDGLLGWAEDVRQRW
ncbi:DUF2804 domain-containing protein [Agromyces archimandritae]|uniref:DUF2804 domain-containing protein n=1 Tax=Agromyces archimandritae TaxID=2781962 RepID=A0A975IPT7_9MICO|nr:DUF2804 domain-containing protein [Agromyces archimandritae]QTX05945.1 DUF2804 domain-containing protein [Agromyces archimandritae]